MGGGLGHPGTQVFGPVDPLRRLTQHDDDDDGDKAEEMNQNDDDDGCDDQNRCFQVCRVVLEFRTTIETF